MKKTVLLVIAIALICAIGPWVSADDINKVEISFAVGDSVIKVNGVDMEVATPYVVEGTTLVPVRVISESFGADVHWDEETREVLVSYGELAIKLKIGSKTAYVNDNETELLTAPEIKDGSTMLPLRFITESFGADVSYDEETAKILVVKEITQSNSIRDYASILKRSSKELVGDSFLNWSIKRPGEFLLTERSFDGRYNSFDSNAREAYYVVGVDEADPDMSIDDRLEYYRQLVSDVSAIDLGIRTAKSGVSFAHVQFKDSDGYHDYRTYFTDKFLYYITAGIEPDEGIAGFNSLCEILDSFDVAFDNNMAEDLSDVDENGCRTFQSKDIDIKLLIPGDFLADEAQASNSFMFFRDNGGEISGDYISVGVYSNQDGHSMKTWVENDYRHNKSLLNSSFSSFGEIKSTKVNEKEALYYEYEVNHGKSMKFTRDVFIDAGPYFYNVAVSIEKTGEWESVIERIVESISIGEIETDKVGKLIRTENAGEIKYKTNKNEAFKFSVDLPNSWYVNIANEVIAGYDPTRFVQVANVDSGISQTDFTNKVKEIYDDIKKEKNVKMISAQVEKEKLDGMTFNYFVFSLDTGTNMASIVKMGYIHLDSGVYELKFACSELYYGEEAREIFDKILKSFKTL